MLECVVNISEGRDGDCVTAIAGAAGDDLLDIHTDPHHNRSVFTLVGEAAPRAVTTEALARIDLRLHDGVHPRLGVVDVVPFVALDGSPLADAVAARDRFATWLAKEHRVPCFVYGPERTLPAIRRGAFRTLAPDVGPPVAHNRAGATAVGARGPLVAYNVWLAGDDLAGARAVATALRGPAVRALGLQVGQRLQVSMNLIDPWAVGPAAAYDHVSAEAAARGLQVTGAELVGLVPRPVLDPIPQRRWDELDLSDDRTVEARLEAIRR